MPIRAVRAFLISSILEKQALIPVVHSQVCCSCFCFFLKHQTMQVFNKQSIAVTDHNAQIISVLQWK